MSSPLGALDEGLLVSEPVPALKAPELQLGGFSLPAKSNTAKFFCLVVLAPMSYPLV